MTVRAHSFATGLSRAVLGLAVLAGGTLTVAVADAQTKRIPLTQPGWANAAIPAPYSKVPPRKKKEEHRLPAAAAGWGASAEPTASADTVKPPAPPLPVRKPDAQRRMVEPSKDVHTPIGRFEVPTTGQAGDDGKPKPEPSPVAEQPLPPRPERSAAAEPPPKPEQPSPPPKTEPSPVAEQPPKPEQPSPPPKPEPTPSAELPEPSQSSRQPPPSAAPAGVVAGKQYCNSIVDAAADARLAWQKQELLQTEQRVEKRIAELNVKIAEYQKWLARREEFSRKAEAQVVSIYTKMKPDAAAQQLTILDEEMAAAVITKLTPKVASALMNEMDPKRAARLTAIITGAASGPGKLPPSPPKDKGS